MALDSDKYIFYYDADYIQEGYYEQELYFEGDYLAPGYFEGEQVVQEAAADLVATATVTTEITVFVPASADLQSTATQTATVGKIIEAAAEFEALFTPSITVQAIRFTDALFEIFTSIETAASLIADIDSVLENIVNLSLQGDRAAGVSALLPSPADLTAEPNVTKDTAAQLETNTNLSITFVIEFESVIASEFSVLARPTVFQKKTYGLRPRQFTSNGNPLIVSDAKIGSGSLQVTDTDSITAQSDVNFKDLRTIDLWFNQKTIQNRQGEFSPAILHWGDDFVLSTVRLGNLSGSILRWHFRLRYRVDGQSYLFSSDTLFEEDLLDKFVHLRLQRHSTGWQFWVNGQPTADPTPTVEDMPSIVGTNPLRIGGSVFFPEATSSTILIDELFLTTDLLTPNTTDVFTPPLQERSGFTQEQQENDVLLLSHFDEFFDDDISAILDYNADLEASFSINAVPTVIANATVNKLAISDLSADAGVITQLDAELESTTAQTATATKIKQLDANLDSESTLAVDANIIQTADALLDAQTNLTAQPTRIIQLAAEFESLFTPDVTVNAIRFVDALFELITDLDVVSQKRTGVFGTLNSSTLLLADVNRTRSTTSTLSAQFDVNISEDILRLASANPVSSFDIELDAEIQRQANAVLESTSELLVALDGEIDFAADLASETQLAATGTGNFNANALLDAQAAVAAAITVQFTLEQTLGTVSSLQASLTAFAVRDEQIYTIRPEQRTFVIEAETRVYTIRPENRTWSIT